MNRFNRWPFLKGAYGSNILEARVLTKVLFPMGTQICDTVKENLFQKKATALMH